MSDNLEKFVWKNRREFDTEEPSTAVWEKIEATLPLKKEAKRFSIKDIYKWSAAAAIVFAALTAIYFTVIRKSSHEIKADTTAEVNLLEKNGIGQEYTDQFKQVNHAIEVNQKELERVAPAQPQLYQQFLQDLAALDSSYKVLETQLAQSPNKDVIIKAILQNMNLKAELLRRQLMIFNQYQNGNNINNNNENHTKNETSI